MNIVRIIRQFLSDSTFLVSKRTSLSLPERRTATLQDSTLTLSTLQLARLGGWEYHIKENRLHYTPKHIDWLNTSPTGLAQLEELYSHSSMEDQESIKRKINLAIKKGVGFESEIKKQNGAGKEMWVKIVCQTEREGGQVIKLRGFIQDITSQKKKEIRRYKQSLLAHYQLVQRALWEHENELGRIAVDLHENISQVLIVARNYLQTDLVELNNEESKHERGIRIVEKAIFQIKGLYEKIETPSLSLLGLEGALTELIERYNQQIPTQLLLTEYNELIEEADELIKLTLIRLVKELICNIRIHSQATEGWISLELTDKGILLMVKDDGIGFYPDKQQWRSGLRRTEIMTTVLGGQLELHSSPGKGCDVVIELPWTSKTKFIC